ncbi:TonB-dependent receptor [Stakelama sp. CBK3Z-3]|uniref:TonB-dependent receptor n=1 Tax=Stakelama flava TaxID=2860338 RepID=A0ABS6XNP0_9SPHN|nr:TonB-dependent receptor [Stakelama flava]MBW4331817.1 TonB-dependent receptor [Stakelama flava]
MLKSTLSGSTGRTMPVAKRAWTYAGLITAIGLAWPQLAVAQQTATGTTAIPAQSDTGDIVVTAQKRSESVLDVPLSVSVLDAGQLENAHITDYADLSRSVPGLSFTNTGTSGTSRIALRGVASASGSATVGVYLDDVSLTFPNQFFTGATLPRLFDIARVEVLRGPQGTLYGDSSLGGTIRFITNKPVLGEASGNASGELSTTEGGGTNYKADAAVNLPIGRNLALRVAGQTGYQSGYIDRVDSNGLPVDTDINSERHYAARATLLWEPAPDLKITPSLQYQYVKTANSGIFNLDLPKFQTDKMLTEPSRDELYVPSLTIEKSFGDYTLTSVTSYMHRTFDRQMDAVIYNSEYVAYAIDPDFGEAYDTISVLPGVLLNKDTVNKWAQEIRFASPSIEQGHRFEWQVGVYADSLKVRSRDDEYVYGLNEAVADLYPDQTVEDLIGYPAPGGLLGYFHSDRTRKQIAGFAEGSFMVTDRLKLTAGIRQVKAWTDYEMNEGGWLAAGTPANERVKANESPLTPKVALNYRVGDTISLYASAAKGFRLGGQNSTLPTYCSSSVEELGLDPDAARSYHSDSLWSYEAGVKSRLFGDRVTMNASVYRIDWHNIQQQLSLPSCGYVITANAGDARSQGGELELVGRINQALTLRATAGYTDAKIRNAAEGSSASDGQHVLGVPDWNITLGADYRRPLSDDSEFFAGTNWTYTGESYGSFSTSNSDYLREDYWVGTFNLGFQIKDFRISGFVKNVLDDRTIIQKPSILFVRQGLTVYPRTIGISVGKSF